MEKSLIFFQIDQNCDYSIFKYSTCGYMPPKHMKWASWNDIYTTMPIIILNSQYVDINIKSQTSVAIRETKIETTFRCHLITVMAIRLRKHMITKDGVDKTKNSLIWCLWEGSLANWYNHYANPYGNSLKS